MEVHAVMGWTVLVIAVAGVSTTRAGVRIDLRPEPPANGESYQLSEMVNVDVFMVDTGSAGGGTVFRLFQLDFEDSHGLSYPGIDGIWSTPDDNQFDWNDQLGGVMVFPFLPRPSISFSALPPGPQIPDGGELLLGAINVALDTLPATLDAVNADNPDPNFGARADFGMGVPGDPVTTWRAFSGDITGGVLVIPEPATLVGMIVLAGTLTTMRAATRTTKRMDRRRS